MRLYKTVSFILMLMFAGAGLLFLTAPDSVLSYFNGLSPSFGMPQSPLNGWTFYLVLAGAYMYFVTVLAFKMFRHPDDPAYPSLLVHAKLASSALSLAFFLLHARYLVYLANFAVDGAIGALVLALSARIKTSRWVSF